MPAVDGRTRHYGTFYGLPNPVDGPVVDEDLPLLLVWGNCQAEAVRVLLENSPSRRFRTARIPPVFELTADDLDPLRALASGADILLAQPVHDNYRDLPLGTGQVQAMMRPGARVVRWPVVRYAGFHPCQAIVRDPDGILGDPPVVPYHDLRTLVTASTGRDGFRIELSEEACAAVAQASARELDRREAAQCDVRISDLFDQPQAGDMFTVNHPGNRVLVNLAQRLQLALGDVSEARDPGRHLLGEVVAPAHPCALEALGLPVVDEADWIVRGEPIPVATIAQRQLEWYREHPRMVEAGLDRHRGALLGLGLL